MLVSTKGRYALRVMVDLAEHQAAGRIPLKEIAARQGSLAPVACLDGDCKGCSRSDECPTLDVWKNLDKLINDYLDGVTLDTLVAPNEGYDYVI